MSRTYKDNKEYVTLKNGYRLEIVRQQQVLEDINFHNQDEFDICKDIISCLETKSSQVLAKGETVSLPYIGRLRKPLIIQELYKQKKLLKVARSVMDKDDYKEYKKEVYQECVSKIVNADNLAKLRRRLITLNKKKYLKKYKVFGEFGAMLWIESLLWLKPIEFNQEVQDVFDEIERNENSNRKTNNS